MKFAHMKKYTENNQAFPLNIKPTSKLVPVTGVKEFEEERRKSIYRPCSQSAFYMYICAGKINKKRLECCCEALNETNKIVKSKV